MYILTLCLDQKVNGGQKSRKIYRQGAKVAKERGEEALNLKNEIRNEEIEPRINANKHES